MARRRFIRIVGGSCLTAAAPLQYGFGAGTPARDGVLLEASAFADPGGWKLDTQHYQQMGGCYLLAHGMGRPVAPARTTVTLPRGGHWNVWVRTRNWCPGDWAAPGRFKVRVNGMELPVEFGTEDGWAWQAGGAVEMRAAGEATVELLDLTGFDGRCDAIFFSQHAAPRLPGEDLVELAAWKDLLAGRTGREIPESQFDLVVVGGGIAGCAAALAARSQGLKVALIQDRPVFGGNASDEVRVHTIGIPGKGDALLKTIDTEHYPNGDALAIKDQAKREATMAASGVDLFPLHLCCGLEKDGDRIASVEAREATTGLIRRFRAPVFIDATGDGWLGFWGGAEWRYGRESRNEFGEEWAQHGDLWSPTTPDQRVMGASVLWNSETTTERSTFRAVPWAMPVAKQHSAINGEWYWEYSANDLDQVRDAERIRDHLLRAIYGSFANAKKHPKNATVALKWVAHIAGKRESRRIMGDYVYTMKDMVERRQFADAVVEEQREVDAHYQLVETGSPSDFLSKALFHKTGGLYYIPFRSLYSRDIPNLMLAGRCFSCSHIGLCGPRVMKTCGQMGIATGYAAALCQRHSATPREVGREHIVELRRLIGYAQENT
ncbi:MAG: FAD-dependent oxidoreductase [Verrucomicrobiales bacterium]|nr:FAD-dependent oxidoreductase [Verrucomicrobiales bacterium]MCP5525444.1 FAD-dependent oxidoreductase [Verrucomicrobiales bacterium]